MRSYHPDATEITIDDATDVKAASKSVSKKNSQRIYEEVVPELDALNIKYNVTKNENGVRFKIHEYQLHIGGKTSGRYTLTIWSKEKS